jgi:hypothetical protein
MSGELLVARTQIAATLLQRPQRRRGRSGETL